MILTQSELAGILKQSLMAALEALAEAERAGIPKKTRAERDSFIEYHASLMAEAHYDYRSVRADGTVELEADQLSTIRRALLVGLSSYGEIERLSNAQEILGKRGKETLGDETWDLLAVQHPTGACDTISEFADALRAIDR